MRYSINARVSNRHVHLTKEVYEKLFDKDISVKYYLTQVGEYASNEVLTIRNGDKIIENVRVVGPFRDYNQVEISMRDARSLGIIPPVRRSGDIDGSLNITLETNKGSVLVSGLVIANRHVHMNPIDAHKFGVQDREKVAIRIDGEKGAIFLAEVKVTDNGFYELHLDTDDANAFQINDNDVVTMIIDK